MLPVSKKPGRPPLWSKRQLLDGIRRRVRVGAPWRDVPPVYGCWQIVHGLFRRWQRAGVWGADPGGVADPGRRRRADYLGGERGFHDQSGAPARRRCPRRG
ncbi:transposase [Amycolatopsis sp. NPDC003861]